jgi:hypothetical protein
VKKSASNVSDEDLDSCKVSEDDLPVGHSVSRKIFEQAKSGVRGYGLIPLWATQELSDALAFHAFPLVAVVLQRMRVRGVDTVLLTETVWEATHHSNKWARQITLQHLRRVPGVLKLEERHKRLTRYQITLGDMWERDSKGEIK